jgi:hypothetical protein
VRVLVETRPERNPQEHITSVVLPVNVAEAALVKQADRAVLSSDHRQNLREILLEKLKFTLHAHEVYHRLGWDEARIFGN